MPGPDRRRQVAASREGLRPLVPLSTDGRACHGAAEVFGGLRTSARQDHDIRAPLGEVRSILSVFRNAREHQVASLALFVEPNPIGVDDSRVTFLIFLGQQVSLCLLDNLGIGVTVSATPVTATYHLQPQR